MEDQIIEMESKNIDAAPIKPTIASVQIAIRRPTFTYRIPTNSNTKKEGETWYPAEYNFVDIGMAEDTDSFVYQANFKKLALAIKAGWGFTSRNEAALKYIKQRISELEVAQGQSFWALIVEVLSNLLRYHNCFLIKARDINASSGKVREVNGRKLKPVAGYFVASPETMLYQIGKDYRIKGYKHIMPDGREKIFAPEDVIHIHIYRKTHHLAGTPSWIPVLDDIEALRRIEENVENLIHQHIYPLYHYKVGTEQSPMKRYEDGLTECDIVRAEVQNMPSDGMLITPERHEITGLGSESRALRAESYLAHFGRRVVTGSGLSEIDFGIGDTANRSTADTLSKLGIDNVKFYQQCLRDSINFEMVRELMAESTLPYNHSDEEQKVELEFNEIDLESQIKIQNHHLLLYQGNIATESETRRLIGREPLKDTDREDLFLNRVTAPQVEAKGDMDIKKVHAQAANKQQPSNQYGTKSGPTGRKSSVERDALAAEIYNQLGRDVERLRERETINLGYINQLFLASAERAKTAAASKIALEVRRGARILPIAASLQPDLDSVIRSLQKDVDQSIDRLFREAAMKTQVQLIEKKDDERLAIDVLEYRIRFIERTESHRGYILGKVAAMKANGIERGIIKCDPNGEDYDSYHNSVIDLTSVTQDALPPFHVNCSCDIEPER
jgi:hypothetical protein